MQRKKTGYFLLYLLSFSISTGIFHAVAHAQEAAQFAPDKVRIVAPFTNVPTPTVFIQSPISAANTTRTDSNLTPTPSQSPTIEVQGISTTAVQPTPTIALPTATPTPTSVPTPEATTAPVAGPADLEALFDKYSAEYGADKELLKKIAKCESGFNPTSNNSGMYLGMYQFASSTWSANRNRMGLDPNPDLRTNAEEAIRTAAYMIARGGQGHWPNCH